MRASYTMATFLLGLATAASSLRSRTRSSTPVTLETSADNYIGQVHVFTFPGCVSDEESLIPIDTIFNVTIGECYNAEETGILRDVFTSIRGWTLGTLPANASCETRAYFDDDCGGTASITDNGILGKCFDTRVNPAYTPGNVGLSFEIECCNGDGKGTCVLA